MKQYTKINNITGWITFAIAAFVYIATIEPTASFWDCSEFITTAFKLEVGHPPGAPFFMIIARFFSLFAFGDVMNVAKMVNIMSALSNAFTILFLFWTITHIGRKVVAEKDEELSIAQLVAVMGSGFVGALAYTFSDSFWFSGVEGEVYAMSSFFTAIVFWAILKWENEADEKYSNRWIILIAYLMGLSIGVHLLNLLTIPAIVFVYYFRKYDVSLKGILMTSLISVLILGGIMYLIIPQVVSLAFKFELMFTNSFGMPYNTGSIFYAVLLIAGLVFGVWYSYTKGKVILNTILTAITVILIGYSSFTMIVIRSAADPPMDQNSPDNVYALLGYLNREQYGDRPLAFGQTFNAPVVGYEEGSKVYARIDGKYKVIHKQVERKYDPEYVTFFPRMYSDETSPNHVEGYKLWTGLRDQDLFQPATNDKGETVKDQSDNIVYDKNKPLKAPSFANNLKYFWNYQVNYMYFRYFMWNFAGRQSDIQGDDGNVMDGNWISGIKWFDAIRLGNQDKITSAMKENKGRNAYYFLPLLLGLLGMAYMYKRKGWGTKYFWVVMLFFFFTGLAIVLYLNQPPFQPRERDYAYAGSFYAFAIYIGFGVLFLYETLKKFAPVNIVAYGVTGVSLVVVPVNMAVENWDDHDRSGRYTARDFAYNYLASCPPNAILFTNGDNDTFPLWYAQEVEGYRTDVRIINLSYLNTDWYIEQMKRKVYNSDPVPFTLSYNQIMEGKRNITYVNENPYIFLQERYQTYINEFQPRYKTIYDRFLRVVEKSKLKDIEAKDYEVITKGYTALTPVQFGGLVNKLAKKDNVEKFGLQNDSIQKVKDLTNSLISAIGQKPIPLDLALKFVGSDEEGAKVEMGGGELQNYFPSTKFSIPVDKKKVLEKGIVLKKDEDKIVPRIEWDIRSRYVLKNHLMVLDLLANNNWERPVCFAITVGSDAYLNLQDYFRINGMVYEVVPIKTKAGSYGQNATVESDSLYNTLMNKFKWGNISSPKVYLDENNMRLLMNMKNNFIRLAEQLVKENKNDSAFNVLSRCDSLMPNSKVRYNYYNLLIAEVYYKMKKDDKGDEVLKIISKNTEEELNYYFSLSKDDFASTKDNAERSFAMVQELIKITRDFKREELNKQNTDRFVHILESGMPSLLNVKNMTNENQAQFYQWYSTLNDGEKQLISLYAYLLKLQE